MTHTKIALVCGCRCGHCDAITSRQCAMHASAPGLLAALEQAAHELHKMAYPLTNDHTLEFRDCQETICSEARAAIETAKGEA